MKSRVLIVGSHSCSNRGDMAILRGLVSQLKLTAKKPLHLNILSREFAASSILYQDHELVDDMLQGHVGSFLQKVRLRIEMIFLFTMYFILGKSAKSFMSTRQKKFAEYAREHDFIIHVGGSFFVDSYGVGQFEYILISLLMDKNIYLAGHSYGPFESFFSKFVASHLLRKVSANFYREVQSKKVLDDLGGVVSSKGADTAWLVDSGISVAPQRSDVVAMTMRDLYPFTKRLGVTQEKFQTDLASLINTLNENGLRVLIVSTCTGFGGYWKDDRVIGHNVAKLVVRKDMVEVVMDELNDVEIGQKISNCVLTIGTRLHSAIISMNFSTPAYTIFYEHKSLGIMECVCGREYCLQIKDLALPQTSEHILRTIRNIDTIQKQVQLDVAAERELAAKMITNILESENLA